MNYSDYEREVAAKGELAKAVMSEFKAFKDEYWSEVKGIRSDLDGVMTALRRPAFGASGEYGAPRGAASPEVKAFGTYLRKGVEALEPHERKALNTAVDSQGGYLAPSELAREIIRNLTEASPIRRLARGQTTSLREIEVPKQTAGSTAHWVGELETRTESTLALGMQAIVMHELATYVDVSQRLIEDADFSIEGLLAEDFGEAFAAAESAAVLTGNGIKKPHGLLTVAVAAEVKTGDANLLTSDGLISAFYALKSGYARTATWIMSRGTAAAVRKLRTGANDAYLWMDPIGSISGDQPPLLLGRPVEIDDSMPAVAAGSTPIVLADFRRALWMLNRPGGSGVSILRDPFTQASVGQVRFHARLRTGAAVVRPEAIVKLKVSA